MIFNHNLTCAPTKNNGVISIKLLLLTVIKCLQVRYKTYYKTLFHVILIFFFFFFQGRWSTFSISNMSGYGHILMNLFDVNDLNLYFIIIVFFILWLAKILLAFAFDGGSNLKPPKDLFLLSRIRDQEQIKKT